MGSCCSSEKKSGEQSLPATRPASAPVHIQTSSKPKITGAPGRTLGGSGSGGNNIFNLTPGRQLSSSSDLPAGQRIDARSAAAIAATVSIHTESHFHFDFDFSF